MIRFKTGWVLGILLAILPISAFAASKPNTKTIQLDQAATVAGTNLSPGQYKLQWDTSDSDSANVTIYRGKEVVATVPAKVIQEKNTFNAEFEFNTSNGTKTLRRVYLRNQVLEFGSANSVSNGS
jgi:hypothetical protein